MGLFRKSWKIGSLSLCFSLLLSNTAAARIYSSAEYHAAVEKSEDSIIYEEDLGEYTVREGDSLWRIAEEFLGSGLAYPRIVADNAKIITNPDFIYPDMRLQLKRQIPVKRPASAEGIKTQEYCFWTPRTWTLGLSESGDAFANFVLLGDEMGRVACLVRDIEPFSVETLSDWEQCKKTIMTYAEENFADRVSNLSFEQYQSQEGTKLFLFSYTYKVDGARYGIQGSMDIYVSEAVCQTEHIQAEFTGFDSEEDIRDTVFHVAASFSEFELPENQEFTVNNSNISISPSEPWAVSGIHNPFVWIDTYFDGMLQKMANREGMNKKTAKERILRDVTVHSVPVTGKNP